MEYMEHIERQIITSVATSASPDEQKQLLDSIDLRVIKRAVTELEKLNVKFEGYNFYGERSTYNVIGAIFKFIYGVEESQKYLNKRGLSDVVNNYEKDRDRMEALDLVYEMKQDFYNDVGFSSYGDWDDIILEFEKKWGEPLEYEPDGEDQSDDDRQSDECQQSKDTYMSVLCFGKKI